MSFVALFLGLLLGVCGWGFLLAAVLAYPDTDNSVIRPVPWSVLCLDMVVSLGILTMTFVIARNWRKVPGMRRFVRIGSVCLLCGLVLISLSLAS